MANRAGNDLESLCDQRVLERLEGEERRDYGRILLSMADEKYARMPGTSSMANGGKNIRRRIEAIARFKKYPAGMALVSVCVVLVLAAPLVMGAQAVAVEQDGMGLFARQRAMASARTTYCTTYAGAMDAYAKAVIANNVLYRAMCAPLEEQAALAEELYLDQLHSAWPPESSWNSGLPVPADHAAGYRIYNLRQMGDGYEGVLVVALTEPPAGEHPNGYCWLGFQSIRTEKEGDWWVVRPLEPFQTAEATGWEQGHIPSSCDQLPAAVYEAQAGDFTVRMRWQSTVQVDSYVESKDAVFGWMSPRSFNTTPQPGGSFSEAHVCYSLQAEYTGDESEKDRYTQIAAAAAPFTEMGKRPQMKRPGMTEASGGSSNGGFWSSRQLEEDWENLVLLGGGGTGGGDPWEYLLPERYAADLYLNRKLAAELTLLPVGGDGVHD